MLPRDFPIPFVCLWFLSVPLLDDPGLTLIHRFTPPPPSWQVEMPRMNCIRSVADKERWCARCISISNMEEHGKARQNRMKKTKCAGLRPVGGVPTFHHISRLYHAFDFSIHD